MYHSSKLRNLKQWMFQRSLWQMRVRPPCLHIIAWSGKMLPHRHNGLVYSRASIHISGIPELKMEPLQGSSVNQEEAHGSLWPVNERINLRWMESSSG